MSASLAYSILAVPMRKCLGKHSCISFTFSINIIYHDFLPLSWRGRHAKSDYAHTIIKHTLLRPYIRHLRLDFQLLRHFCSLPPPHHVTASQPSPGWMPPEHGSIIIEKGSAMQGWESAIYILSVRRPQLPQYQKIERKKRTVEDN